MILKMMLIVFGIFLLILDLFMYARQKLTDGIGLGWAIVSATFLVSGIAVSTDAATYLWNGAKSVVLFAFAVFVVIILFLFSVCSLSNLFFRFHTTTLTEACSNELKQHHL